MDSEATLFVSGRATGGDRLVALTAAVASEASGRLTLRCTGGPLPEIGRVGILVCRGAAGPRRARVSVLETGDFVVRVQMLGPFEPVERRLYGRAEIVLRLLPRRLGPEGAARAGGHLSLVPAEGGWLTEEVVLSPAGLRGPLPGDWAVGDRLELRIHVPGPRGGEHLLLAAEVRACFADESPPEVGLRFVDVPPATRARLAEIVDRSILADLLEEP